MKKFLLATRNYNIIVVDTEFAEILENIRFHKKDDVYAQMKRNIDITKCIQVRFAFSKEDGSLPCNEDEIPRNFNLQFDRNTDLHTVDAMDLLKKYELNLEKHVELGILTHKICEAILNSDLLLMGVLSVYKKTWETYSGNYDIGHSVKIFQPTNKLPDDRLVFGDMIRSYFGKKCLMSS